MPLYEYVCTSCETRFEKLQTVAQVGQATCPHCNRGTVQLQLSVFASPSGGVRAGGCGCTPSGCGCRGR
ncbi:MAG: FmdB family zinc ribbon protein [Terriglobales bacterium]